MRRASMLSLAATVALICAPLAANAASVDRSASPIDGKNVSNLASLAGPFGQIAGSILAVAVLVGALVVFSEDDAVPVSP